MTRRYPRRILFRLGMWALLLLAIPLPIHPALAQASPILTLLSDYEPPLCRYGYVTYTVRLSNPPSSPNRTGTLHNPIPASTHYVEGSVSAGADYNRAANRIEWAGPLAAGEGITLTFVVTVSLAVSDGMVINNGALAILQEEGGGTMTLNASRPDTVDCSVPAATPEPWEIIPEGATMREALPLETPSMLQDSVIEAEGTIEPTGVFSGPTSAQDENPPGSFLNLFLPAISSDNDAQVATSASNAPTAAQQESPRRPTPCTAAPPWWTYIGLDEESHQEKSVEMGEGEWRPISVTANGQGDETRFSTIWVHDDKYGDNWILEHEMSAADYQTKYDGYGEEGFKPIVVDAYGDPDDPLYTAIWVKDDNTTPGTHGVSRETMLDLMESNFNAGYRPLWFTGLSNGDNTQFSGLWVKDNYTGTAFIDLTSSDLSAGGIAQMLTDDGYRLQQISAYDTPDGRRYAASWVLDTDCPERRWEAFDENTHNQYLYKAMVQNPITAARLVANGVVTLKASDFGTKRYVRIALDHELDFGTTVILREVREEAAGIFQDGDIVIFNTVPNHKVRAEESIDGNLRMRPWQEKYMGPGQPFLMDSHFYRLVLRYDAATQKWVEMQRNNLSPDYYYPISLDEGGEPDDRDYASVWLAGPTQREFDPASLQTGIPPGPDPLGDFDEAMRVHMERRGIPAGALAVTKDGKLVFAKAYTWDHPNAFPAQPTQPFRIASMSKSLTAVGILRLVQDGLLNLDWRIKDIPGFDAAVLSSNLWIDARIKDITVRQLLHHTGGWDRDVSFDPMIEDFTACSFTDPDALPTTAQGLIDWMRSVKLDHPPGWIHAYSNFGYNLLGRIIEVVSGESYGDYMEETIFGPLGMSSANLTKNLSTEPWPGEVFYYTPNNTIESSNLGFVGAFPDRDICDPDHADVVPSPYGGLNLLPMDSHGGWIASAPDLAQFLVSMESSNLVLSQGYRNLMWSRPDGRSRRVGIMDGLSKATDYTIAARIDNSLTFPGPADTGQWLLLSRGLNKFSSAEFIIATPGAGYELRFLYSAVGGMKELDVDTYNVVDGTDGLTQDGWLTFTPPADWEPSTLGGFDDKPRYTIFVATEQNPTTVAQLEYAWPRGETEYGLGWDTEEEQITLQVAYGLPFYPVGSTIVGTKSKASAVVVATYGLALPLPNARVIVMRSLAGGPFAPGENLFIGEAYVGKALGRDTAVTASASHGGLLWGTRTWFVHRSDGINYVVLFNQDNHSAYYLPNEGWIISAINEVIEDVNAANTWPNVDLFP